MEGMSGVGVPSDQWADWSVELLSNGLSEGDSKSSDEGWLEGAILMIKGEI